MLRFSTSVPVSALGDDTLIRDVLRHRAAQVGLVVDPACAYDTEVRYARPFRLKVLVVTTDASWLRAVVADADASSSASG